MFLVDGPVLLDEALTAGADVRSVHAEPDALDTPVVHRALAAGIPVHDTAAGALSKVLDLKTPRGLVAIVGAVPVGLADVLDAAVAEARPVLVLVALQDPGNVGTLVRVAEAAGCAGVLLTPGSVDLHNPKTVRATAGAVFRVPVAEQVDPDALFAECERRSMATHATVGRGGVPLEQAPLRGPVAVLIGGEAHGLPDELAARCIGSLTVPMEGAVESLNAAIAGSVVLFEAARQRRAGAPSDPSGGGATPMRHNDPSALDTGRP